MRLIFTVLGTLSLGVVLAAADFTGTWKLNVEKSQLPGNDLADLTSETMTISETGPNTYTTTIDIVTKSGGKRHLEINRVNDGKEHPATGVGFKQEGRTEISRQINPFTREITAKRDGKVIGEITSTVSPDGKVMTNHRIFGTSKDVHVFEKQ